MFMLCFVEQDKIYFKFRNIPLFQSAAAVASYLDRNVSDVYKRVCAQTIANHQMAPTIQMFYPPPRHIGWLDCCTDLNSTVNCLC